MILAIAGNFHGIKFLYTLVIYCEIFVGLIILWILHVNLYGLHFILAKPRKLQYEFTYIMEGVDIPDHLLGGV